MAGCRYTPDAITSTVAVARPALTGRNVPNRNFTMGTPPVVDREAPGGATADLAMRKQMVRT